MAQRTPPSDRRTCEQAGRIVARRLRQARNRQGLIRCPVCLTVFEAAHLIKCPHCRTVISARFQDAGPADTSGKMELDFFPDF